MMRSMFSGVSGLKNHQTRMDVIGNNISNVNTTGYKTARATFSDMISQTLSGASSPTGTVGGTNPKQIGLGSSVAAIETIFTDGSVQSTGKNTDLCLSSENSLFVINTGSGVAYTRNGAFEFDAQGNYVQAGKGYYVQGWMADPAGEISTTGNVGNIKIESGKSMSSKTTSSVAYSNNLNAALDGVITSSITVKYADGTSESVANYVPQESAKTSVTLADGNTYMVVGGGPYETGAAATINLTSPIKSITASGPDSLHLTLDGTARYKAIDYTGPTKVSSGTYQVGSTYSATKTIDTAVLDPTTQTIKLTFTDHTDGLTSVTVPAPTSGTYKAGDSFPVTLDVTAVQGEIGAIATLADGQTVPLTDIRATGATVPAITGNISAVTRLGGTYSYNNKEVASVTVNSSTGATVSGVPSASYSSGKTSYSPITTGMTVFDSLGNPHDVQILFTKTDANTWKLSLANNTITEPDQTKTSLDLTSTDLKFDASGTYVSGSGTLNITYSNGAAPSTIDIALSALTQYAGSNTVSCLADGNAAGTLSSISIDTSGVITGTYTNGLRRAEAQVALQRFNNPSGLTKIGDSLYTDSNNAGKSGEPNTATALGATLTPSALEMSTVDVADQFTDMIVTQRGFQSNSKIITVSDEMLETLINMKR